MSDLPVQAIKDGFDRYEILADIQFQYGTAGFRTEYVVILIVHPRLHRTLPENGNWTLYFFEWGFLLLCGARSWMAGLLA